MSELSKDGRFPRFTDLETRIGYQFKDVRLAIQALTHSSYGDGQRTSLDNERLEFLGDRVLGLLTAQALFDHSLDREGVLARRLNALVRKETCADIARQMNLGDVILMSGAEVKQGGRDKTSILGDCCEALIAAIYLDGGFDAIQEFYERFWRPILKKVVSGSTKDPKTELQELAMSGGHSLPDYDVIGRTGPDHNPEFIIRVHVDDVGAANGTGRSKREAERAAAIALLENWPDT